MSKHTPGPWIAAEVILRVNTHEALVSSLSTLVTLLNKDKDGSYFLCEEASEYVDEANALLASLSTKPTEIIEPGSKYE